MSWDYAEQTFCSFYWLSYSLMTKRISEYSSGVWILIHTIVYITKMISLSVCPSHPVSPEPLDNDRRSCVIYRLYERFLRYFFRRCRERKHCFWTTNSNWSIWSRKFPSCSIFPRIKTLVFSLLRPWQQGIKKKDVSSYSYRLLSQPLIRSKSY